MMSSLSSNGKHTNEAIIFFQVFVNFYYNELALHGVSYTNTYRTVPGGLKCQFLMTSEIPTSGDLKFRDHPLFCSPSKCISDLSPMY